MVRFRLLRLFVNLFVHKSTGKSLYKKKPLGIFVLAIVNNRRITFLKKSYPQRIIIF